MDIVECQAKAKEKGFDTATFTLVGPGGKLKCRWIDAYFGSFIVDGQDGFNTVDQVRSFGLECLDFKVPRKKKN